MEKWLQCIRFGFKKRVRLKQADLEEKSFLVYVMDNAMSNHIKS